MTDEINTVEVFTLRLTVVFLPGRSAFAGQNTGRRPQNGDNKDGCGDFPPTRA